MDEPLDLQRLLVRRRLTRAVEEVLREDARQHLATLAALLRPRTVLGDFIAGAGKDGVRGADKVWKELETLYAALAPRPPFGLGRELRPPLEVPGVMLEMAPLEYRHEATAGATTRSITVTRPFVWQLSYSAYGPARLRELLADRNRDGEELQRAILLALVLHLVVAHQPGVARVFAALRLPLETQRLPEFGELPLTCMASVVPTTRPPDGVVLESTEMTGTNRFQEVVDPVAVERLEDPLRTRLVEALRRGRDEGSGGP